MGPRERNLGESLTTVNVDSWDIVISELSSQELPQRRQQKLQLVFDKQLCRLTDAGGGNCKPEPFDYSLQYDSFHYAVQAAGIHTA